VRREEAKTKKSDMTRERGDKGLRNSSQSTEKSNWSRKAGI
jgi:hypothetical protein